jgi:SAM-dependent methyltransferase
MRDVAPSHAEYIGIDIAPGPGVDVVLQDPYRFPFEDSRFDAVVSTSCFEHDQMFWLTFLEMARVARGGGYIYLNAPSNGKYHPYPVDNWRFYPDAAGALTAWARREGQSVELLESFIGRRKNDTWNDCVMIFAKPCTAPFAPRSKVVDAFPDAFNIRGSAEDPVTNFSEDTEDMMLLTEAQRAPLSGFNAQRYLAANPDVRAAGINPYEHYMVHGWREGRRW